MKVPRIVGWLSIVAGLVMIGAGALTYGMVSSQLSAENITVPADSAMLPGDTVDGPFSAYAQAQIIQEHALKGSGGRTYAELGADAAAAEKAGDAALVDELKGKRASVMNASFLRASLFTSVVSFGVAALVMGLGVLAGLVGWALLQLAGRPTDRATHGERDLVGAAV